MGESGGRASDIVGGVNRELWKGNDTCRLVTLVCGVVDTETGLLTLGRAGDAVPVLDAGGLDAFRRFVSRLPEGIELRVSNLEFQPLRTFARAGIQPIPGRLAFFPNRDAALADL